MEEAGCKKGQNGMEMRRKQGKEQRNLRIKCNKGRQEYD